MRKKSRVLGAVLLEFALGLSLFLAAGSRASTGEGLWRWWASDSSWTATTGEVPNVQALARLWENRPEKFEGLLMFERMAKEGGEWWWFTVRLVTVDKVTFTRSSKVVLIDKRGKRIESEAVLFWPDKLQTNLYDSRKSPVVVTMSSAWRGMLNLNPTGTIKFPAGSVVASDVAAMEIVGAIAGTAADTLPERR